MLQKPHRYLHLRLLFQIITTVVLLYGCKEFKKYNSSPLSHIDVVTKWADMTLFITKNTPANTPTYSSRALAYIGVTMYESVVNSSKEYNSLVKQLSGLDSLSKPDIGKEYNWLISLNASQALIIKSLYSHTAPENLEKVDSLEKSILLSLSASSNQETVERSLNYGKQIAKEIYEWSVKDGGHKGYLQNFTLQFIPQHKPGNWKPSLYSQVAGHLPLHPYWGNNRNFLQADRDMAIPNKIPYDTNNHSAYYQGFQYVYDLNKNLSQSQKEVAMWWNDDPSETFTPPGHSYNMGTIVIKKVQPSLIKSAETYGKIGLSVADAFINCWRIKYHYSSERPSTFINNHIDPYWESFWPDPPFPSFPSGHAFQAGATAEVLTEMFGLNFKFSDSCHAGRPDDKVRKVKYKSRNFNSFWEAAKETAQSRLCGGIHTKEDNEVGLALGKQVGVNVSKLKWTK